MSKDEVKLSSVNIKVGDVTVEMTIKQGRELYKILAELFAKDARVFRDIQYVPYYLYPDPCRPRWDDWHTTWGATTLTGGSTGTGTVCYEAARERT